MDRRDLKSASTYVNNLLASRGLLRGHAIPFHKPGEDDAPAKIINLVHELIARRDVCRYPAGPNLIFLDSRSQMFQYRENQISAKI